MASTFTLIQEGKTVEKKSNKLYIIYDDTDVTVGVSFNSCSKLSVDVKINIENQTERYDTITILEGDIQATKSYGNPPYVNVLSAQIVDFSPKEDDCYVYEI